ncbi:hypothetical protein HYALB_00004543 [Hymenoscyphus albidus]|uniref:FAD-binding FR-type domain-containing protein n=1 Tax=Hymenoscyphus albidus TaxID=595503 RepID=A0A9N9QD38_9HELO|nr:hypothetical protein HYALB_00004543 [Hymenoscyphus albidus]
MAIPKPAATSNNSTANAAAAAAEKKTQMLRAIQQTYNVRAAKYFAAAMAVFILLFTIYHWTRLLYSRYASKSVKNSSIMKSQVFLTRLSRRVLNNPVPGFDSIGHLVVVIVYLGINVSIAVTNVDFSTTISPAKRCGWLAFCNIAFLTFLALKNTPLAYLTAYSYESLNPLHQIAGYTTIVAALLHVTLESTYFKKMHHLAELVEHEQIFGMVAAGSLVTIFITAMTLKKLRYEAFYIIHITMYMTIIVMLCMHRPEIDKKEIIILFVAASMWGSDRILRGVRILWYSRNNQATIYPLPHGGTRVVLRRSPSRAIPGTHCFLWVPRIRHFETHPFTIASTSPNLELVISASDGFTRDLHEYAVKNPGASLHASIDGSYGALPNFSKTADKLVLVAGGSGASFTFGVALDTIKKLASESTTKIDFIWTVREEEALTWFANELDELRLSPRVSLFLYTTRPSSRKTSGAQTPSSVSSPPADDEKSLVCSPSLNAPSTSSPSVDSSNSKAPYLIGDIEKQESPLAKEIPGHRHTKSWDSSVYDVVHGRPDIAAFVKDVVAKADKSERIVIAGCGPGGMMDSLRKVATGAISVNGPSVEYHSEAFGW